LKAFEVGLVSKNSFLSITPTDDVTWRTRIMNAHFAAHRRTRSAQL